MFSKSPAIGAVDAGVSVVLDLGHALDALLAKCMGTVLQLDWVYTNLEAYGALNPSVNVIPGIWVCGSHFLEKKEKGNN